MTPRGGKGKSIVAFAAGAFLGAGITLLLAPKSGERMRRDIRRVGQKALNRTQALRLELSRSLDNMADDVWEELQAKLDSGRNWTDSTISEIQNALSVGKDFIRNEIDKVRGK